MSYAQNVVGFLSVLTVVGQAIALIVAVLLLMRSQSSVMQWIARNAMGLMLIGATIATVGSLYFSEVAGWTPCRLCWFQRIVMYPQVVLLPIAMWKNDKGVAKYILALSLIGLVIAGFHYGEQVSAKLYPEVIDPNVPCDASGTSCRSAPFFHFGYITIPMMAFTVFALNALGSLAMMRRPRAGAIIGA